MAKVVVALPLHHAAASTVAVVKRMSEIRPRGIDWLWPGRLALGKLSLIVGDPGQSKSTLIAAIAAHVSTGRAWPDGTPCPQGSVVMASAEDDPEDTIRPRLDAAGADPTRIHLLEHVVAVDGRREHFGLRHVDELDALLTSLGDVVMVSIDPISAYTGEADSHKNADVRGLLAPLSAIAAKHRVALLAVSHLNKGTSAAAIYRTSGSLGFVAASRACLLVATPEDQPDLRYLLTIKNNLAKKDGGIAYRVCTSEAEVPYVEWLPGSIDVTADEALAVSSPEETSATRDCAEWLACALSSGPKGAKTIQSEADQYGFSPKVLRRARERLGVLTRKADFKEGWVWELERK